MIPILAAIDAKAVISVGLLVVILAAVVIFLMQKLRNSADGEEKVREFLEQIRTIIEAHISSFVNDFNFSDLDDSDTLMDKEMKLMEAIYEDIWELAEGELDRIYSNKADLTYILIKKTITKEFVEGFVYDLMRENGQFDKLVASITQFINEHRAKEMEETDAQSEADNAAIEAEPYESEVRENISWEDSMTEEEKAAETVIPPTDEVQLDPENDESIEVVDTVKEDVDMRPLFEAMDSNPDDD